MTGFFERLWKSLRIVGADEIVRRYFVLNGFDGALTTLGIIMGAHFAGVTEAKIILSAGFGATMAMGISGAWGAYMSETAERTRSIKELEEALFASLENSVIERASRVAVLSVTLIDALSPVSTSVISLAPIVLSLVGVIPLGLAVALSFLINVTILFLLGAFLGRVSKTSIWVHGGFMVLAGFSIMLFVYIIDVAV